MFLHTFGALFVFLWAVRAQTSSPPTTRTPKMAGNVSRITVYYFSTLPSVYHIRSRERAKYATVLHSKIMYCTANSRFHRFSGRRTGKKQILTRFFKVE